MFPIPPFSISEPCSLDWWEQLGKPTCDDKKHRFLMFSLDFLPKNPSRTPQVCASVPGCQVSRRAETLDRAEAAFVGLPRVLINSLMGYDWWIGDPLNPKMAGKRVIFFFHGKIIQLIADLRHGRRPFSLILSSIIGYETDKTTNHIGRLVKICHRTFKQRYPAVK